MKRFREVLQRCLDEGKVQLPSNVIWDYEELHDVYRGVKITTTKNAITQEDFDAQAEIPQVSSRSGFNQNDISNYGCSFFDNLDMINLALHMPRKNKRVAKGILKKENGPILKEGSHIMCFLYEGAHIENDFEVI